MRASAVVAAARPRLPRLPRSRWRAGAVAVASGVLTAALSLGCGSADTRPVAAPLPPRAAIVLPPELQATCRALAREAELPVLCPPPGMTSAAASRAVPSAQRLRVIHEDLEPDPCAYLNNVDSLDADPRGEYASHVLLGGRCGPLPLPAVGRRLPMDPPESLRLVANPPLQSGQDPAKLTLRRPVVLRRLDVRGQPGVLVRVDPRPDGGLHGAHFGLIWNEAGRGYVVSAHYPGGDRGAAPRPAELRALTVLAEGLRAAG